MNIHETMAEQFGLAKTYAEDGAFHTAARVLTDLAATVKNHANACDLMEQAQDVNDVDTDEPEETHERCAHCGAYIDECECDYR